MIYEILSGNESYKDYFLDKFPNAEVDNNGYPTVCMRVIFGYNTDGPEHNYGADCYNCWDSKFIKK